MITMFRSSLLAAITIIDVMMLSVPLFAQRRITLNEIYRNPEKYYDKEVTIIGTVEDVYYNGFILRSDIGWEVEILTDQLPQKGQELEVIVWIEKNPLNSVPILKKLDQKDIKKNKSWLYMIGVFGFLLLMKFMPK